jgi:hypothetical protein
MGGSNQATADTLPLFRRTTTLTVLLDADIKTNVDLAILTPGYTFSTPVWGGRLGLNVYIPVGTARTQIDQLVTGALGPIGFANQSSISDRLTSFGVPDHAIVLQGRDRFPLCPGSKPCPPPPHTRDRGANACGADLRQRVS